MNARLTATMAIVVVAIMVFSTVGATSYSWFSYSVDTDIDVNTAGVHIDVLWDGTDINEGSENIGMATLSISNLAPGNKENHEYNVISKSSIEIKVRTSVTLIGENNESAGDSPFNFKFGDADEVDLDFGTQTFVSDWDIIGAECTKTYGASISMDADAGNEWAGKGYKIKVETVAYQSNAELVDKWDGRPDTSWYDPENKLKVYAISTAEQFLGLSELVTGDTTFKGVTFTLENDLDLYCEDTTPQADGDPLTFRPIGDHSKNGTFEGTFDGNGHTISNLYQNGWDLGYEWGKYGSYGLFGNVNDATIKNLTISNSESYIEGGDVSFVAGSATGTCVFENIMIKDSTIATYNNGCGGIIGWSGAGNYTFKNITLGDDVVLGGLWGSFDSSIGGIVGQAEPGATYVFDNVTVNCRLDAYNDCTASYAYYNYRMCGMLIGRCDETTTIDGKNYPDLSKYNLEFTNVTVNYGKWMYYHYCEPTPGHNSGRGMRIEAGYAYGGLPEDFDHTQCVDNHYKCIPFDQLIGGDQIAVKGLVTVDGVTVNYPDEYTCGLCGKHHGKQSSSL